MGKGKKPATIAQMSLVINGKIFPLTVSEEREFKTGSRGWYVFGKATVGDIGIQFGGNAVIIGSKPKAPAEVTA